MHRIAAPRLRGFALLEALIALLVAAFAIVGIVKLQGYISKSSAEAVARSEALALMQERVEGLRAAAVTREAFLALPSAQQCGNVASARSTNTTFQLCSTLADAGGTESRAVQVSAAWTDSDGNAQNLAMQSILAWDDPLGQAIWSVPPKDSMIAPVGAAKKGTGKYPSVPAEAVSAGHGLKYYTLADGTKQLLDAYGNVLLYLNPKNGAPQDFTVIEGNVYFDNNAGNNKIPPPSAVQVRLSSEGICVQDTSANGLKSVGQGNSAFTYFEYGCYVGPGWYGNVGVTISDSINGTAANPTICVGDSNFNNGLSDGTLISAHSVESATRTYRGFRAVTLNGSPKYLSTGVAGNTKYPSSGAPLPADYPSYYGSVSTAQNFFNHHFLITHIPSDKTQSCRSKMPKGTDSPFVRNAGKYYCIKPHNWDVPNSEVCPSIWPNFENQVGTGGTITYPLDVTVAGSGKVTSSPSLIDCGSLCSSSVGSGTQVVLTATPGTGQSFSGWSGACSGNAATCTLTMDAAKVVTATFSATVITETLTVTKAGSGTGTVTSSSAPAIDCGATCSVGFGAPTTVTLTASAGPGSNFAGWSGACTGTGTCTVAVSGAVGVTATFNTNSPTNYTLSIVKSGSGTVARTSPSNVQINCGSTCSDSVTSGTAVTLTATPASGYTFTGWSGGGCSGTGTCTVTVTAATTVTANFGLAACNTIISGSLKDKNDDVLPPILAGGASAGTCSKPTSNATNYNCALTASQGSTVILRGQQQGGNGNGTVYQTSTPADCTTKTVNF